MQKVGLASRGDCKYQRMVEVHRLVQTLARLDDDTGFEIQKLMIYYTKHWNQTVNFSQDYFWPGNRIPAWALENERKCLLWLQVLRFMSHSGDNALNRNDLSWKDQLTTFINGAGIEL